MSSTFLTRLRVGEILVDTKGVSRALPPGAEPPADAAAPARRAVTFVIVDAQLAADRAADRARLAEARRCSSTATSGPTGRRLSSLASACSAFAITRYRSSRSSSRSGSGSCSGSRSARTASCRMRARTSRSRCAATSTRRARRTPTCAASSRSATHFERADLPGAGARTCCRAGASGSSRWAACRRGYTRRVRDAVEPAGGKVDSVSVIKAPLPLGQLASELKGTSSRGSTAPTRCSSASAGASGRQLVNGGDLIDRLRHDLFSTSRGEYRGLDGVVYVRDRAASQGRTKQGSQDTLRERA